MFKHIFKGKKKSKQYRFDPSIPRAMYWSHEIPSPDKCPECNGSLESEYHLYLLFIKDKQSGEIEPFLTGNDGGSFCSQCPVIVLNTKTFEEAARTGTDSSNDAFTVVGILDLNAIPEDKKHLPLGAEGNPLPLVQFKDTDKTHSTKHRKTIRKKRKKAKSRKKRKSR